MAIQDFNSNEKRVLALKGEVIGYADSVEVLGITGMQKVVPKNSGATVLFTRFLPYGGTDNQWINGSNVNSFAANHITTEGVTPSADVLTSVDVTATLQEYSCLYAITNKAVLLGEYDIPKEMSRQVGQRIGLLREMVRYGALKGMTNVFYGGTGNSPSTVNGTVTLPMLRKITRSLKANHAKMVTQVLRPGVEYGSKSVEAAYLVFCSTDLESAIRDLPNFKNVSDYAQRKPVHEQEIGSVEGFRFILSPELAANINTGAAVGSTGLFSTGGSNIDLYPVIVVGEDAWGQVALRGTDSLDVTYIQPGQKDKNDPLGQRGYIGASTFMTATVLNNGWGAVAWVGATN